jgi:hypothetical protein
VGGRELEEPLGNQRMVVSDGRRRARARVRADGIADVGFLRRGPHRQEPLCELSDCARCGHRQTAMVSAARASRHLGLRPSRRSDLDRGEPQRPQDSRRRADHQDEHALHLRSRHGRSAIRHGRTPGPTQRSARRSDLADAAISATAAAALAHDVRSGKGSVCADARTCSRTACSRRRERTRRW